MPLISVKAVLFDLDGTLVDTEPSAVSAVRRIFKSWKLELDQQDARIVVGVTWERAFEHLFAKYPIPVSDSEGEKQVLNAYAEELHKGIQEVPGSTHALRTFAARVPVGLVTGSDRFQIETILKALQIRDLFQIILGAEDYSLSKPSPDGYLKASKTLDIPPENCLVFEDSSAGIRAAKIAGMKVIAIAYSNHFFQDQSEADLIIPDFHTITTDWISKNLSIDS